MNNAPKILFEYLRGKFYDEPNIELDVEKLDEEYVMLGRGLVYFTQCLSECKDLSRALAAGKFDIPLPPRENALAGPLKSLHASLKHLTWQAQQVAKGDYKQTVDFMGDFSSAFNTMTEQLAERQHKLEKEVETIRRKSEALEQSNQLLSSITQYIPQQIIVKAKDTQEILFMNDMARKELDDDEEYFIKILGKLDDFHDESRTVIRHPCEEKEHYLSVTPYLVEWEGVTAEAYVIADVSPDMTMIKDLEERVYKDDMTQVYNRLFGMLALTEWLGEKRCFSLVFADLDNLKHINDKYGHNEGDRFIITVAEYLGTLALDAIVCRLGGDEFMLLVPESNYDETHIRLSEISRMIRNDEYLNNKEYYYSFSFGVVHVDEDNTLSESEIMSLADERMYEHKKAKKKNRGAWDGRW